MARGPLPTTSSLRWGFWAEAILKAVIRSSTPLYACHGQRADEEDGHFALQVMFFPDLLSAEKRPAPF